MPVFLQIHQHWLGRWHYLQANVHSAAYALHPAFCRNEFDNTVVPQLHAVMEDFAKAPGCKFSLDDFSEQYDDFVTALHCKSDRLDDETKVRTKRGAELDGAFTAKTINEKTPTKWIQTFMNKWPALKWMALKIINIPSSASYCEHAWSIEGWMHCQRRNRLKQPLVEKLVRGHGNLIFKEHEEANQKDRIIWDVELEIDEPEDVEPTVEEEESEED